MNAIRAVLTVGAASVASIVPWNGAMLLGSAVAGAMTPTCHSSWLTPVLGRSGVAMGTTWYTLEIVNHSKSNCSLSGTPVARPGFLTYSMLPWANVGPRSDSASFAGRGGTVIIRSGKLASVSFGVSTALNYPPKECAPKFVSGVQLTFTKLTPSVSLDYFLPHQSVCTKLASTSVTGIALGTHFP
jgi:hypothetical protein